MTGALPFLPAVDRGRPRSRRWLPIVLPVVLIGLLVARGWHGVAIAVAVATLALAALRWLHAPTAHRLDAALERLGQAVASAVGWVLLTVVAVLVVIPVSWVLRLLRRDPLHADAPQWVEVSEPLPDHHMFGREDPGLRRPSRAGVALSTAVRWIGVAVSVLVLNYLAGWAFDEYVGSHDVPPGSTPSGGLASVVDTPNLADEPWADAYGDELDSLPIEPVPFLLSEVGDTDGEMITSAAGVRGGWAPDEETRAVVWILGGGAAWGLGQRDDHTIASELARLAAGAGTPLSVVNLGQPGDTTWQATMRFEQALAERSAPDVAVLYGGADDMAVQVEAASPAPSHYNTEQLTAELTGDDSDVEQVSDLWDEYVGTGLLPRVAARLLGVFGGEAASAGPDPDALGGRVVDLVGRSLATVVDLATPRQVEVIGVWQAAREVPGDGGAYRALDVDATDPALMDLRSALDSRAGEVYLDGIHTDETGARVAAEALWPAVRRALSRDP